MVFYGKDEGPTFHNPCFPHALPPKYFPHTSFLLSFSWFKWKTLHGFCSGVNFGWYYLILRYLLHKCCILVPKAPVHNIIFLPWNSNYCLMFCCFLKAAMELESFWPQYEINSFICRARVHRVMEAGKSCSLLWIKTAHLLTKQRYEQAKWAIGAAYDLFIEWPVVARFPNSQPACWECLLGWQVSGDPHER